MGYQDRDYYRRDGPSFLGTLMDHGKITKWLIAINVIVFLLQFVPRGVGIGEGFQFTNTFDLDVEKTVFGFQIWRLLTHMFLHQVDSYLPWHLLLNMYALYMFGRDIEDLYGPREFLAVYLVGGLASGLTFVVTTLLTGHNAAAIGASGAIFTVLVLFACHYPTRTLYLIIFPIPAWLLVIGFVAIDALTFLSGANTGVAVAGHLGGAAFGFAYYKLHWRLSGLWPSFMGWRKRRSQPRLRVYHEPDDRQTPVSVAAAAPAPALEDEHLEAKMDAVLEKISRVGKDNLTENEKAILLKASELLRKRRS